jgi:hypothetical protein
MGMAMERGTNRNKTKGKGINMATVMDRTTIDPKTMTVMTRMHITPILLKRAMKKISLKK